MIGIVALMTSCVYGFMYGARFVFASDCALTDPGVWPIAFRNPASEALLAFRANTRRLSGGVPELLSLRRGIRDHLTLILNCKGRLATSWA